MNDFKKQLLKLISQYDAKERFITRTPTGNRKVVQYHVGPISVEVKDYSDPGLTMWMDEYKEDNELELPDKPRKTDIVNVLCQIIDEAIDSGKLDAGCTNYPDDYILRLDINGESFKIQVSKPRKW